MSPPVPIWQRCIGQMGNGQALYTLFSYYAIVRWMPSSHETLLAGRLPYTDNNWMTYGQNIQNAFSFKRKNRALPKG